MIFLENGTFIESESSDDQCSELYEESSNDKSIPEIGKTSEIVYKLLIFNINMHFYF